MVFLVYFGGKPTSRIAIRTIVMWIDPTLTIMYWVFFRCQYFLFIIRLKIEKEMAAKEKEMAALKKQLAKR